MRSTLREFNHNEIRIVLDFIRKKQSETGGTLDEIIARYHTQLPALIEYRTWLRVLMLHIEKDPLERFLTQNRYDHDPLKFFEMLYRVMDHITHAADSKSIASFASTNLYEWLQEFDFTNVFDARQKLLATHKAKLNEFRSEISLRDFPTLLHVNDGHAYPTRTENRPIAAIFKEFFTRKDSVELAPEIANYVIHYLNQGGLLPLFFNNMLYPYLNADRHVKFETYQLKFNQADKATFDYNTNCILASPTAALENCSIRYRLVLQTRNRFVLSKSHHAVASHVKVGIEHSVFTVHDPLFLHHLIIRMYRSPQFSNKSLSVEASAEILSRWQSYIAECATYLLECESLIRTQAWPELINFQLNRSASNDLSRQLCLVGILIRLIADPEYALGSLRGFAGLKTILQATDLLNTLDHEHISSLAAHSKKMAVLCLKSRKNISKELLFDILLYYPELYSVYCQPPGFFSREKNYAHMLTDDFIGRLFLSSTGAGFNQLFDLLIANPHLQLKLSCNPLSCKLMIARLNAEQKGRLANTQLALLLREVGNNPIDYALEHFERLINTEEGKQRLRQPHIVDYFLNLFEAGPREPESPSQKVLKDRMEVYMKKLEQIIAEFDSSDVKKDTAIPLNPIELSEIHPRVGKFDLQHPAAAKFYKILIDQETPFGSREVDRDFVNNLTYIPEIQLYEFLMRAHLMAKKKYGQVPDWMVNAVVSELAKGGRQAFEPEPKPWHFNWDLVVDFILDWAKHEQDDQPARIPKLAGFFIKIFLDQQLLSFFMAELKIRNNLVPSNLLGDLLQLDALSPEFYTFFLNVHRCDAQMAASVFSDPKRVIPIIPQDISTADFFKLWLLCIREFDQPDTLRQYKPLFIKVSMYVKNNPKLLTDIISEKKLSSALSLMDLLDLAKYASVEQEPQMRLVLNTLIGVYCVESPPHMQFLEDAHLDGLPIQTLFQELSHGEGPPHLIFKLFKLLVLDPNRTAKKQEFYKITNLVNGLQAFSKDNLHELEGNVLIEVYAVAKSNSNQALKTAILEGCVIQITNIVKNSTDGSWHSLLSGLEKMATYKQLLTDHVGLLVERAPPIELETIVSGLFYRKSQFLDRLNNKRVIPEMIELGSTATLDLPLYNLVALPEMNNLRLGLLEYPFYDEPNKPSMAVIKLLARVLQKESVQARQIFFDKNPAHKFEDNKIIREAINPPSPFEKEQEIRSSITAGPRFHKSPPRARVAADERAVADDEIPAPENATTTLQSN